MFWHKHYADRGALVVQLAHEGINYGFMVLSTPRKLAMNEAEKTIIKEVADDIAVGLYRLYLEKLLLCIYCYCILLLYIPN